MSGENLKIRQYLNNINDKKLKAIVEAIFNDLIFILSQGSSGGSTIPLRIPSSSFTGDSYTNTTLIGKTAMVNFDVWSSSLLTLTDDYLFNSTTGTITIPSGAQNIMIQIYS